MMEEEYAPARVKPFHRRRIEPAEPAFSYEVRPATAQDLGDIREIYNGYVRNSVVTFDEDTMSLREWRSKFAPTGGSNPVK